MPLRGDTKSIILGKVKLTLCVRLPLSPEIKNSGDTQFKHWISDSIYICLGSPRYLSEMYMQYNTFPNKHINIIFVKMKMQ